jgi:hypothetical protein
MIIKIIFRIQCKNRAQKYENDGSTETSLIQLYSIIIFHQEETRGNF